MNLPSEALCGAQSTQGRCWKEEACARLRFPRASGELRGLPWLLGTSSTSSVHGKGLGPWPWLGLPNARGAGREHTAVLLLLGTLCPVPFLQGPRLEHPHPWPWAVGREGRVSVSRRRKQAEWGCGVSDHGSIA